LKALHKLGIKIYLHTFEYGRGKPKELDQFCEQVFYYERYSSVKSILSKLPYAVKSRSNDALVKNLKKLKAPIFFEGLHSTSPLISETFDDRKKMVRTHNIEHLFYEGQSKSERRIDKKLFFKTEAKKLKDYESVLHKADRILTISPFENNYFNAKFIDKAIYIPVFHQNTEVRELSNNGDFALYNGDLRLADNIKSVLFLIDIFKEIDYPLIVASSFKNDSIFNKIKKYTNIQYVVIEDGNHIIELLKKAQINVLPTFQKTGIKLKLINTLYNGRFCLVTTKMVEDTGLESLCEIASTKEEFTKKINELINTDYTNEITQRREEILKPFNVEANAKKMVELLY